MAENFYGITDMGNHRDNNEDDFLAENDQDNLIIGAAIDGVGGYSGGEIAAAIAKETLLDVLHKPHPDIITNLKNAILLANQKIYDERKINTEHNKMACVLTTTVADINNNKFYYAHIGDTRLYLLRDRSLVKISRDHSVVGFLEESGRLSEAEAMSHPRRNEINKALGFEPSAELDLDFIETGESPFLPGDLLMLCTDGLTDMINNKEITEILIQENGLKEKCHNLVKAANEAGGRDNITAVLIKNDRPSIEHTAVKPERKKEESIPQIPPITETEEDIPAANKISNKRKKYAIISIALLIPVIIFTLTDFHKTTLPKTILPAKNFNGELQDSISNGKNSILNLINSPLMKVISDSFIIKRDSLQIKGNGVVMVADSSYKGSCFIIDSRCKYILLDSLTLKNFDIGILVKLKGLHLNHVQFEHCRIPVKYQFIEAKDSLFKATDTLKSFN